MKTYDELEYLPLDSAFMGKGSQRGWSFTMLKREGYKAIYQKVSEEGCIAYEVIRIKLSKGGVIQMGGVDVTFEPKERYPKDEEFGREAWTFGRLEDAERKFNSIKNVE